MNVPTAPYTPVAPSARDAAPYLPWLIDKAVRAGRDNGYGDIVDAGLVLVLGDLGVRQPVGGFVDSDGRNAQGRRTQLAAPAAPAEEEVDEDEVAAMVEGWSSETAAAVLAELANRVA